MNFDDLHALPGCTRNMDVVDGDYSLPCNMDADTTAEDTEAPAAPWTDSAPIVRKRA